MPEVEVKKEVGIKETLEIIGMLKEVCHAIGKVFADGKFSVSDLSVILELGSKLDILMTGIDGGGKSINEVKNLDQEEVMQLVIAIYECVKKFDEGKKLV